VSDVELDFYPSVIGVFLLRYILVSNWYKKLVMNVKSNLITGLERPWGFQEAEAPRFQDNRRMKMVRLSALFTGCLYPPGNIPGTHFC